MMSPIAIRTIVVGIVGLVCVVLTASVKVSLLSPVVIVLPPPASSCCLVLSPLLVTCRRFRFSLGLCLPPFCPEMLEVVSALLVVAPGRVEGGDGGLRLQPRLLDHPATHEVAGPVEAVGAMNSNQGGLWLRTLAHSREELFHNLFTGHNVTGHEYFPVNQAELLTVPRLIIFVCVCEVNNHFQVGHLALELSEVPLFILVERNFKSNESGSFHYSSQISVFVPPIRYIFVFRHFQRLSR